MKEKYQKNVDNVSKGVNRFFEKTFKKIDMKQPDNLEQVAANGPLMVVSTHRSHTDYFLLGAILNRLGVKFLRFAAGDNLTNLPYIGPKFRGFGAFPVERARSRDRSYIVQLSEEVASMLLDKQSMLVFPEGGRSYKGNMMNINQVVIGGSILAQAREPSTKVTILPCAISYEKLPELAYFETLEKGRQLRRAPKNPLQGLWGNALYFGADAWAFIKFMNVHRFGGNFGDLFIDFGQPFTVGDCTNIEEGRKKGAPDNFWAYRTPAKNLADEIHRRFLSLYRLLPQHLLAAALAEKESIRASEAKAAIDSLMELAKSNNRNVQFFEGMSSDDIFEKGAEQLQDRKAIDRNGAEVRVRSRTIIDYYAASLK